MQHLAPDLRLVHRVRGGEALKFVEQKKNRQADHERQPERTPHPDRRAARFQRVDETLNRLCATRHLERSSTSEIRN